MRTKQELLNKIKESEQKLEQLKSELHIFDALLNSNKGALELKAGRNLRDSVYKAYARKKRLIEIDIHIANQYLTKGKVGIDFSL